MPDASSGQERPINAEAGWEVPTRIWSSRLQPHPDAADRRAYVRRPAAEKRGDIDPAAGEVGAHAEPGAVKAISSPQPGLPATSAKARH